MPQSFYRLYYHIVWGTKYRERTITPEIEKLLKEYIPKKIKESGGIFMALNMTQDHLHLLASIPPKTSVAEFVHHIKGSSSHLINLNLERKRFYWQSGYGVLSLSAKGIPFVTKYIINQKQKHADNSLIDVLEYAPTEEERESKV